MKDLFYKRRAKSEEADMDMPSGTKKLNNIAMKTTGLILTAKAAKTSLLMMALGFSLALSAKENIPGTGGAAHRNVNTGQNSVMSNCIAGVTQKEISLNNVRTRILTDGDMWWDFTANVARYEVPKGSNSFAMFAGSLWFGGMVTPSDLRVAAMTYRQTGIDFWPGPLDPKDLSIDPSTCQLYDKVFQFNKTDVQNFYSYWNQYNTADPATPTWIKDYPGNTIYPGYNVNVPVNTAQITGLNSAPLAGASSPMVYLAPYVDVNSDGNYNYANGDYPAYNVSGIKVPRGHCVRYLFGDVTNFWVFNDNGNKHTETGSTHNIGVEVRAQAFEFATNDELNDMTFYNYEIINWSTNTLKKAYFTVWNDCDLGYAYDDYVGCDVGRGLGYQYNGDNYDEDGGGLTGYHDKLPAIGCDFFQGPYADVGDSIDNDRDGCIDCSWSQCADGHFGCPPAIADNDPLGFPEQCIMSRFTYYNNSASAFNGNPGTSGAGIQYYNLMTGTWENSQAMTYDKQQGLSQVSASVPACKFLFPGTSDPLGWGLGYHPDGYRATSRPGTIVPTPGNWTEAIAGNLPTDRRFLQSAGPFTLLPGAVNYVTFGLPFARSASNNNLEPIPLMEAADDKAQALFDNCFKVLDGPDAPDLTIQELDKQLLVTLTNNPYTSNNYEAKRYADVDPAIVLPQGATSDKVYRFEGYKIFQLLDGTVSVTDLTNNNLARLVFQCDIKNGVSQLINYNSDPTLGTVPQLMVSGADAGIQNSFSITQDQFASSDKRLINFKNYYYMAVSYAYNNFLTYKQDVGQTATPTPTTVITPTVTSTGTPTFVITNTVINVFSNPASGDANGQKKPYLQGRNNVKPYTAIPHDPAPEAYGTVTNSKYGNGPQVTRIEGQGNGGYALDLTDASINDILNSPISRAQQITYVAGRSPILVKVTDPLRVVKGDFSLKFITGASQTSNIGVVSWYYNGNPPIAGPATLDTGKVKNINASKWFLAGTYTDQTGNKVSKTWLSDEGINLAQEKIITGLNNEPLGFSVTIKQTQDPQVTAKHSGTIEYGATVSGDLLESSIQFEGNSWLSGVKDIDGTNQDWILAGSNLAGYKDAIPAIAQDIVGNYSDHGVAKTIVADPGSVWETVVGGTWAPYRMVNYGPTFPALYNSPANGGAQINGVNYWSDTRLLSSVDVVFTNDQSKWTHCPVIDMNTATDPNSTIPYKWQLRREKSRDKNGSPTTPGVDPVSDSSMSWFPGYAINIETGERLNIIFSENSADAVNHGNDMVWNPTNIIKDAAGNLVNGGMHYIYILGHNSDGNFTLGTDIVPSDARRYDLGASTYQMLQGPASWGRKYSTYTANQKQNKWAILCELFKDIMWTSMPLSTVNLGNTNSNIPAGKATVKIRVPKPFKYGLSTLTSSANTSYTPPTGNLFPLVGLRTYSLTPLNSNAVADLPADVVSAPQNGNFPMYKFSTNDLVASNYQQGTAQAALAKINIVPNPYYAHNSYEHSRIDLEVKIINLPVKCTVKIYSLAGTLIKTLNKDNSDTYLVWDLHNTANIQIASGLYILHIDAPGVGERIIKWYGVMRPYDLQSF